MSVLRYDELSVLLNRNELLELLFAKLCRCRRQGKGRFSDSTAARGRFARRLSCSWQSWLFESDRLQFEGMTTMRSVECRVWRQGGGSRGGCPAPIVRRQGGGSRGGCPAPGTVRRQGGGGEGAVRGD